MSTLTNEELNACIDRHMASMTEDWLEPGFGLVFRTIHRNLTSKISAGLRASLQRINDLEETDPFWQGKKPEIDASKIYDYFGPALVANPNDDNARWAVITYRWYSLSCFSGELFLPMIEDDFSNIRWPVAAGLWMTIMSGSEDKWVSLLAFLKTIQKRCEDSVAQLSSLASSKDQFTKLVSQIALNLIHGRMRGYPDILYTATEI